MEDRFSGHHCYGISGNKATADSFFFHWRDRIKSNGHALGLCVLSGHRFMHPCRRRIEMARFLPNEDPFTLEDQLKILGTDELLDFWEESQLLDKYLDANEHDGPPSTHYENAILNELRLRYSMGRI